MTESNSVLNPKDVSRDIFSATIGSVFCCYTGQPLDTIKVRMQTSPNVFPNVLITAKKTVGEEGVAALWKGAVPTAMGMAAENAMAFGVNEALKRAFPTTTDPHERPDLAYHFMMGTITGCFSALVLLPSEVIKAKTQVMVGDVGASSSEVYKRMIKKQGFRSLFCGLDSQLMRDGPFYGVFFGSYQLCCYSFRTIFPSIPEELNYFLSGGFAGMIGWTVAMPFDVPKTNVQSRWDTKIVGSYFPQMAKIARERGVIGLYSGLGPTLIRAFPANAALFLGVEMGKRLFDSIV